MVNVCEMNVFLCTVNVSVTALFPITISDVLSGIKFYVPVIIKWHELTLWCPYGYSCQYCLHKSLLVKDR